MQNNALCVNLIRPRRMTRLNLLMTRLNLLIKERNTIIHSQVSYGSVFPKNQISMRADSDKGMNQFFVNGALPPTY